MPWQSSAVFILWFVHVQLLNLISSFRLPLIPLHLVCTQHLQKWHRMEWMPATFLQTTQGNLPSIVTFPAFSKLITIFVFLPFTLDPFDCSVLFQSSSLPFPFLFFYVVLWYHDFQSRKTPLSKMKNGSYFPNHDILIWTLSTSWPKFSR